MTKQYEKEAILCGFWMTILAILIILIMIIFSNHMELERGMTQEEVDWYNKQKEIDNRNKQFSIQYYGRIDSSYNEFDKNKE